MLFHASIVLEKGVVRSPEEACVIREIKAATRGAPDFIDCIGGTKSMQISIRFPRAT